MSDNKDTITKPAPKKAPPKAENIKPEPKPAWTPSTQVNAALVAIAAVDSMDKKGIAQVVKAAISLRTSSKAARERLEVEAG